MWKALPVEQNRIYKRLIGIVEVEVKSWLLQKLHHHIFLLIYVHVCLPSLRKRKKKRSFLNWIEQLLLPVALICEGKASNRSSTASSVVKFSLLMLLSRCQSLVFNGNFCVWTSCILFSYIDLALFVIIGVRWKNLSWVWLDWKYIGYHVWSEFPDVPIAC